MPHSAPAQRLLVLTYHRIGDPAGAPPGMVSASPRGFERQMRWLGTSGRAVSLDQVLAARAGTTSLPRGAVLVTFDDAYADFRERSWPVLRRHGVPVTLFVPTAFPGRPGAIFWWDRLYAAVASARGSLVTEAGNFRLREGRSRRNAYRHLRDHVKGLPHDAGMAFVDELVARLGEPPPNGRVLSWDELRALAAEGVTLAPHTRTHPRLDRLAPERLDGEVAGSIADLEAEIGSAPRAFAYPDGGVSPATREAVRSAGIELAFTTARGVAELRGDTRLSLPRLNVSRRTSAATLRARAASPARRPRPVHSYAEARPVLGDASAKPAVAYVMSRFPKLSETFILTEILALERRGVCVELYPLLRERARSSHPEAERLAAGAHYVPFLSPAVLASQAYWLRRRPRPYLTALRDVARGTFGSLNFFVGGLAIFPKVAHAARLMESNRNVAHVHCHFSNHPAVAGLVLGRLTGLPYSFTAHGSDLHVERRMLREKVAGAAFVATVSEYNRRLIVSECRGRFADKVHVIRAGIDTTLFAPNGNRQPRSGPLRVVCVGTLHEVKGQEHLVEACRLLVADGTDVTCRLVGNGTDRRMLARRIEESGLAGRVVLAGAATRPEVAAELAWADVLVAPSVPTRSGRREGIPVALMEAMCCGLPVVASDLSGIPELVHDGVTGLLTEPGDTAGIAAALRRLHEDPVLRRRLGSAGRERILAAFDVERSAAQLAGHFGLAVP